MMSSPGPVGRYSESTLNRTGGMKRNRLLTLDLDVRTRGPAQRRFTSAYSDGIFYS
jgi:hypothetical protein